LRLQLDRLQRLSGSMRALEQDVGVLEDAIEGLCASAVAPLPHHLSEASTD
jgi:hypothetical protein